MMTITEEMLAAAYELLRVTPPIRRWKLPPATEIRFSVTVSRACMARLILPPSGRPIIEVSEKSVSTLLPLCAAVAHEMVHLHEHLSGDMRADCKHGRSYRRRAKAVCDMHRFDPMQFGGLE
jgi:hypothetical protein